MTKMYTRNRPAGEGKSWVKRLTASAAQRATGCETNWPDRDPKAIVVTTVGPLGDNGGRKHLLRLEVHNALNFGRTRTTLNYRTWTCLIGLCHASSETAASQIKPIL